MSSPGKLVAAAAAAGAGKKVRKPKSEVVRAVNGAEVALDEDSDSDFEVHDLRFRDDSNRTLWQLLREEDIRPADLLHMKKLFEENGRWHWETGDSVRRIRKMVDPGLTAAPSAQPKLTAAEVVAELEMQKAAAARADDKAIVAAEHAAEEALTKRTKHQCRWKGRTGEGDVYACRNTKFRNPVTREIADVCAYHTPKCCAKHQGEPEAITFPNDGGFCPMHYLASTGREPVSYATFFNVPGVVLHRKAQVKHPLAPDTLPAREGVVVVVPSAEPAPKARQTAHFAHQSERVKAGADVRADQLIRKQREVVAAPLPETEEEEPDTSRYAKIMTSIAAIFPPAKRFVPTQKRAAPLAIATTLTRVMYTMPIIGEDFRIAATKIQAVVRMHLARRVVGRIRVNRVRTHRSRATKMVQRFLRTLAQRHKFRDMYFAHHAAATKIQRAFRLFRYRKGVATTRTWLTAALKIQRWQRLRRLRGRLHTFHQMTFSKSVTAIRSYALHRIRRLVRSYRLRHLLERMLATMRKISRGVRLLQSRYRIRREKRGAVRALVVITGRGDSRALLQLNSACFKVHRWWRRIKLRKEARWDRMVMIKTIVDIQRLARGYMCRQRARELAFRRELARSYLAPGFTKLQVSRMLAGTRVATATSSKSRSRGHSRSRHRASSRSPSPPSSPHSNGGSGAHHSSSSLSQLDAMGSVLSSVASGLTGRSVPHTSHNRPQLADASKSVSPTPSTATSPTTNNNNNSSSSVLNNFGVLGSSNGTMGTLGTTSTSSRPPLGGDAKARAAAILAAKTATSRKPRVPVLRGASTVSDDAREDDPDFVKIKSYVNKLEAAFWREDKGSIGAVSRAVFNRVLRSAGFKAATNLMMKLQNTFLCSGDNIDHVNFIAFARQLRYICPVHRVLVCPICLYTGPCEACKCKEFAIDEALTADLTHMRARLCECGHHERRHLPAMRIHSETPVPAPDPMVLRLTLPRVSSLAREKCGGLSGTRTFNEGISVEAFRSTLATEHAEMTEEVTATLSLGASGLASLEAAAKKKREMAEIECHMRVAPMTPRQRVAHEKIARQARVAEQVGRKWNALDAWMDQVDEFADTTQAMAHLPSPTQEEMALYDTSEDMGKYFPQPEGLGRTTRIHVYSIATGAGRSETHNWTDASGESGVPAAGLADNDLEQTQADEEARRVLAERNFKRAGGVLRRPARSEVGSATVLAQLRRVSTNIHESADNVRLTSEMLRYWEMLVRLAFPGEDGSDVIGDEWRMTDLIFHNYDFLASNWERLVNDIRTGSCQGGPPALTPVQRRQMEAELVPDVARAHVLEQVFKTYFRLKPVTKRNKAHAGDVATGVTPCLDYAARTYINPPLPNPTLPIGRTKPSPYTTVLPGLAGAPAPALTGTRAVMPPSKRMATLDASLPNLAAKLPGVKELSHLQLLSMLSMPSGSGAVKLPDDGSRSNPVLDPRDPPLLRFPGSREAFGCSFPACGARFTSPALVYAHFKHHTVMQPLLSATEADAYLLRMWDSVGLNNVLQRSGQEDGGT